MAMDEQLISWGIPNSALEQIPAGSSGKDFTILIAIEDTPFDIWFDGYKGTVPDLKRIYFRAPERDIYSEFEAKGCKVWIQDDDNPIPEIANGAIHDGADHQGRTIVRVSLASTRLPCVGSTAAIDFILGETCQDQQMEMTLDWILGRLVD